MTKNIDRYLKVPKEIYLQVDVFEEEITWCSDRVEDTDVKYIREDKVKQVISSSIKEHDKEIISKLNKIPTYEVTDDVYNLDTRRHEEFFEIPMVKLKDVESLLEK